MSHRSACNEESAISREGQARTRLFWTQAGAGDTTNRHGCTRAVRDATHHWWQSATHVCQSVSVVESSHHRKRQQHGVGVKLRHEMLRAHVEHRQAKLN